jgi:hypothetical protein
MRPVLTQADGFVSAAPSASRPESGGFPNLYVGSSMLPASVDKARKIRECLPRPAPLPGRNNVSEGVRNAVSKGLARA